MDKEYTDKLFTVMFARWKEIDFQFHVGEYREAYRRCLDLAEWIDAVEEYSKAAKVLDSLVSRP